MVSKHLASIFKYYNNEESITHQKISLYSSYTTEEFDLTLMVLKNKFPLFEIRHSQLKENHNNSCATSSDDLNIIIPHGILNSTTGLFEYRFQSHIKNIFGTIKVEIKVENGKVFSTDEQFFMTSIGK